MITGDQLRSILYEHGIAPADGGLIADRNYQLPALDSITGQFTDSLLDLQAFLSEREYRPDSNDCLTPETPIVCEIIDAQDRRRVDILEIQEIAALGRTVRVLSPSGSWVNVSRITSKDTTKPIVRWCQRGILSLTSDHRVRINSGEWKEIGILGASDYIDQVNIGAVLPSDNNAVNPDLAWAMGLFFADGYSDGYRSWRISNCYRPFLERAKRIFSGHFLHNFEINAYESERAGRARGGVIARQQMYHLEPKQPHYHRDNWRQNLCVMFRGMFYAPSRLKKVPAEIINASPESKSSFLEGVVAGDGTKNRGLTRQITIHGTVGLYGLIALIESLGMHWYMAPERRRKNTVYLRYGEKGTYRKASNWKSDSKEPFPIESKHGKLFEVHTGVQPAAVFDLTCEGGEFIAANFVVHNCDDFVRLAAALAQLMQDASSGAGRAAIAVGEFWYLKDTGGAHAVLLAIVRDHDQTRKLVFYDPQPRKLIHLSKTEIESCTGYRF